MQKYELLYITSDISEVLGEFTYDEYQELCNHTPDVPVTDDENISDVMIDSDRTHFFVQYLGDF